MAGPLQGLRIVELAGIGSGPFAATMLADHGADVVRIERPSLDAQMREDMQCDILLRSRRIVALDLKSPDGREAASAFIAGADGVIESYRPGVAERLGLGPDAMLQRNPRLVYGRVTGWGREGPYAPLAGHDINYLALSGALHAFGRVGDKPTPPINLVATFGGGLMLAFAMVSALLHARTTGEGQVVDCATTDSASMFASVVRTMMAQGQWRDERGVNLLDTGAPFYDSYETSDGRHIALGAVEPQFYALLRDKAGLDASAFDDQMDRSAWPKQKALLAEIFVRKTRAEWCAILEHSDACFAPVLSMREAPDHPHNRARGAFVEAGGVVQARPTPTYSKTVNDAPRMWPGRFAAPEHGWDMCGQENDASADI